MTVLYKTDPNVILAEALSIRGTQAQKRLVLVGGGHAHAQVLRALNKKSRPKNLRVTLIDMQKAASYSGMVPGCVAKIYKPEETLLQLKPVCDWAGIEFVHDEVTDVDLEERCVRLRKSSQSIPFDVVSVDIGSSSRGLDDTPGARQHTIPTRPISELVRRIDEAEKTLAKNDHVVVIGGGAAGIELSMSLMGRWKPRLGDGLRVTLLDSGDVLLPDETPACREKLNDLMRERGIEVMHRCHVSKITEDNVVLQDGLSIPYNQCIWATGAGSHPLAQKLKSNGLAINERGWIRVNKNLQSLSHPFVFAAGDCSSIEGLAGGPPPKAGVYAVRAGPVLIENLTGFLQQKMELTEYKPQDDFLKLLVCGDGTALGFRFGVPVHGKWVFQLKDRIDQMFMSIFKKENLPVLEDGAKYDTSQYDAVDDSNREPLDPFLAAELLQRTDDDVDYMQAWNVFRDMAKDELYKSAVLEFIAIPIMAI